MNIRMEDIKKAVDESVMENIRKDAHIKILKDIIKGVTGALIESSGWGYIGTESFPCPDCGCRDGNHLASDCELLKVYEGYKAEAYRVTHGPCEEAQRGQEDV